MLRYCDLVVSLFSADVLARCFAPAANFSARGVDACRCYYHVRSSTASQSACTDCVKLKEIFVQRKSVIPFLAFLVAIVVIVIVFERALDATPLADLTSP
ncbi:hypothetical protein HBH46_210460 [Parastagonospora nodorum]|nr:hypothetical protein HBH46_210460 [Parastagonospora nodorum]